MPLVIEFFRTKKPYTPLSPMLAQEKTRDYDFDLNATPNKVNSMGLRRFCPSCARPDKEIPMIPNLPAKQFVLPGNAFIPGSGKKIVPFNLYSILLHFAL
jgi:hypothetical protein